jgi:peptidoglycan hydrolase-like protein with peptidoglycan-binding domain
MALKCQLFAGDAKLEAAAVSNPAHILRGAVGAHVAKIQQALISLDEAAIAKSEVTGKSFGAATEKAVLAYKKKRKIINKTYQNTADAIVGVMTMKSLDDEMLKFEASQDEITVLSALASVLGYTPNQPRFVVNDRPLRNAVRVFQDNIPKSTA